MYKTYRYVMMLKSKAKQKHTNKNTLAGLFCRLLRHQMITENILREWIKLLSCFTGMDYISGKVLLYKKSPR